VEALPFFQVNLLLFTCPFSFRSFLATFFFFSSLYEWPFSPTTADFRPQGLDFGPREFFCRSFFFFAFALFFLVFLHFLGMIFFLGVRFLLMDACPSWSTFCFLPCLSFSFVVRSFLVFFPSSFALCPARPFYLFAAFRRFFSPRFRSPFGTFLFVCSMSVFLSPPLRAFFHLFFICLGLLRGRFRGFDCFSFFPRAFPPVVFFPWGFSSWRTGFFFFGRSQILTLFS